MKPETTDRRSGMVRVCMSLYPCCSPRQLHQLVPTPSSRYRWPSSLPPANIP